MFMKFKTKTRWEWPVKLTRDISIGTLAVLAVTVGGWIWWTATAGNRLTNIEQQGSMPMRDAIQKLSAENAAQHQCISDRLSRIEGMLQSKGKIASGDVASVKSDNMDHSPFLITPNDSGGYSIDVLKR